jgi:hypothetical protein
VGASPALAAGAVFGNGTPGFVVSASDATVPLTPVLEGDPDIAGEPSIGIDWRTGAGLFMAGWATQKVTFDAATSKVTWADASPLFGTMQNLDPILATDPVSGTTIAGGDTGSCSAMFRSTDDGASWLPTVPCPGTTDHPTVGWAPSALNPGTRVWYYCQQQGMQACATSTDDGVAWVPGSADPLLDCESFHGHIRGSADGTTYLPSHTCFDANSNIRVGGLRTTDDGASWQPYTIPNAPEPPDGFDPAVATTPDNTLYEAWGNESFHPVIAASKDHGDTWGPTTDLASTVSPPLIAATFPTLVAGDNGRVAYSYLGTSAGAPGVDPFKTGFHGIWYLYTSYTYDGGQTWTTVKDTATPVQYGEIDAGGTTTGGQRNLLDFMDSSLTKDGRVVVAFADGCLSDCEAAGAAGGASAQASAEALSTHAWATVAYQNAGKGLFGGYDVIVAPGAPTLTATSTSSSVNLAWTAPADNGGAPVTKYNVYRSSGGGAASLLGSPSVLSWSDATAVRGTTYSYTVRAVNSVGEGAASNVATGQLPNAVGAPVLSATVGKGLVKLSWTVPDSGGTTITGYQVYRGLSAGTETLVQTISTGTSYADLVAGGSTYYYRVAAVTAAGPGALSNEVAATPKK